MPPRKEKKEVQAAVTDIREARLFEVPEWKEHWLESGDLAEVAQTLIERWPRRFGHIAAEEVVYLWQKKGGRSGRRDRISGAIIPTATSLLMHVYRKGIIIWLAADHVKSYGMNERQVEAQIFKQLSRIGKNAKGAPILQADEVTTSRAELQEYGYWSTPLKRIENIQIGLGLVEDEPAVEGDSTESGESAETE